MTALAAEVGRTAKEKASGAKAHHDSIFSGTAKSRALPNLDGENRNSDFPLLEDREKWGTLAVPFQVARCKKLDTPTSRKPREVGHSPPFFPIPKRGRWRHTPRPANRIPVPSSLARGIQCSLRGAIMREGKYESDTGGKVGTALTFLLIGLGAGVVVGMLCAPKSGRQIRRDLRRGYETARDRVEDWSENARDLAEDVMERGSDLADDFRERVRPLARGIRRG